MRQMIKRMVAGAILSSAVLGGAVMALPPCDVACYQRYQKCLEANGDESLCQQDYQLCLTFYCGGTLD